MSARLAAAAALGLLAACGDGGEARIASLEAELVDERAEADAARARAEAETARADGLTADLAAEREAGASALAALRVELDVALGALAETTPAGRDAALEAARADLALERQESARLAGELVAQLDELLAAREELGAQGEATTELREALAAAERARDAAVRDAERRAAELADEVAFREELREETVTLTVARAELETRLDEVRVERDRERARADALAVELAAEDPDAGAATAGLREDLDAARTALTLANAELARLEEERLRSAGQLASLERELATEQARRLDREQQWLEYARFVESVDLSALLHTGAFPGAADRIASGGVDPPPEPDPEHDRAQEQLVALRALFAAEEVAGFDLFELGRAGAGWYGPAVFRLLDDRGRLAGGLYAERLSLEGSHAGRTLTLVLTEGYESRAGERFDFEDGVRRIALERVDPAPWVEAVPDLFPPCAVDLARPLDDGRHDLGDVRLALNERLARDASGTVLTLRRLGGVADGVLRDVHLVDRDRAGRLVRDLLADRLTLVADGPDVVLLLEDGVSVRDGRKAAFVDGRMRLRLPGADPEDWATSGLPLAEATALVGGGDTP